MKSPANPYVGPSPLTSRHKLYGRDLEVARLMNLLIAERIVLLYSPSGAGKSSLLKAQGGLLSKMKARGFDVPERSGEFTLIRVGAGETGESNRYGASAMASLNLEGRGPTTSLIEYLDYEPTGELLVFDQFEEVVTVDPHNHRARRLFFEELGEALRTQRRWAVFAMREDYLARLDPYRQYIPTRLAATFRLDLLPVEASIKAIRQPALKSEPSIDFTAEAAKKLALDLADIEDAPDDPEALVARFVEPVQLQVVCRGLWDRLEENTRCILPAHVESVANIDDVLGDYYARSVQKAAAKTNSPERTIRDWFGSKLINAQDFRAPVQKGADLPDAVVEELESAYIVRSDTRLGATYVELAHDRLIKPVRQNNQKWRWAKLEYWQRQAERWRDNESDQLLSAAELAKAKEWAQKNKVEDWEKEYIEASEAAVLAELRLQKLNEDLTVALKKAEEALAETEKQKSEADRLGRQAVAEAKRSSRNFRVAAAVAVLAVLACVIAWKLWNLATQAEGQAVAAESKAKKAESNAKKVIAAYDLHQVKQRYRSQPALALAYLVRALDGDPDAAVDQSLKNELTDGTWLIPASEHYTGSEFNTMALSRGGKFLMTVGKDSARVWDLKDGKFRNLDDPGSGVESGILSDDGTRAVLFLSPPEARVFSDGKRLRSGRGDWSSSRFAASSLGLAWWQHKGKLELVNTDTGKPEREQTVGDKTEAFVFNPAGDIILLVHSYWANVWRLAGNSPLPAEPAQFKLEGAAFGNAVCGGNQPLAAVSADGGRAAVIVGRRLRLYRWNATSDRTSWLTPARQPCSVGFTRDNRLVLTGGAGQEWLELEDATGAFKPAGLRDQDSALPAEASESKKIRFQSGQDIFAEVGETSIVLKKLDGEVVARALMRAPVLAWAISSSDDGKKLTLVTAAKGYSKFEIWNVEVGVKAPHPSLDLKSIAKGAGGLQFKEGTSIAEPLSLEARKAAWKASDQ